MFELSDICSHLFGWFESTDFSSMIPSVGTICVVCLLYLALKLGLGIDPLPYIIP